MILAIDIGNTNIVIGCCSDNKIMFVERVSTNHDATELEYGIHFKTILDLHGISPKDIDGAIISSVVPSVTFTVKGAVKKVTDKTAMVVGPGIKTGLSIVIDNPAQLGSDLVVDAVAGINEYPLPLIIFDMGTANTVSVIDENRNYLGGMIMPGLKVSLDSLTGRTSQLPKVSLDPPKKIVGTNTVDCMKSGLLYGSAAQIDGIIQRINASRGVSHTVVATGGLASTVIPLCNEKIILDDALLLKGLMIIYNKNV